MPNVDGYISDDSVMLAERSRALGVERTFIKSKCFLSPGNYKTVEAWRWRDFAVRRCLEYRQYWQISCLPVGLLLPIDWCSFEDFDDAVAAMKEIAALRNDWHIIRQADFTKQLEAQLKEIVARHNPAVHDIVGACGLVDRTKTGRVESTRPNEYGEALDK